MRGLISIWLVAFSLSTTQAQQSAHWRRLLPVSRDGRVGFIDRTGKIQIEPQFADAEIFAEVLARVSVAVDSESFSFREGFIDSTGGLIIPARFSEAYNFSENLALARGDNGLYSFINKRGLWAIRPQFHDAQGKGFNSCRHYLLAIGENEHVYLLMPDV
jgi:hypothetical protein